MLKVITPSAGCRMALVQSKDVPGSWNPDCKAETSAGLLRAQFLLFPSGSFCCLHAAVLCNKKAIPADLSTVCCGCVSDRLSPLHRGTANKATGQQQCTPYRMQNGLDAIPPRGFFFGSGCGLHAASTMIKCSSSSSNSSSMHSTHNKEHACSNT